MWALYISIAALVTAVVINSMSVYLQKRYKFYTTRFGSKDQRMHTIVILPFWLVFITLAFQLQTSQLLHYEFINVWFVGLLIVVTATLIFIAAVKLIGSGALVNSNFFKPQKIVSGGIFRFLKNPIYDSYALFLLGFGLIDTNWGYLVLSAFVWVLLTFIESRVENFS